MNTAIERRQTDVHETHTQGCVLRTWRTVFPPNITHGMSAPWCFSISKNGTELDFGWDFRTRETAIEFAKEYGVWMVLPEEDR